jgi:hypothetical protein
MAGKRKKGCLSMCQDVESGKEKTKEDERGRKREGRRRERVGEAGQKE